MGASIEAWLDMGGYAAFIWPSYGVATVVLLAILAHAIRTARGNARSLDLMKQAMRGGRGTNAKEDIGGEA